MGAYFEKLEEIFEAGCKVEKELMLLQILPEEVLHHLILLI